MKQLMFTNTTKKLFKVSKTKLFTIALAFIGINAFSQITVTDANLINIGDVIYQAQDTVPGTAIIPGNSGANQSWDFSSAQVMDWDTSEFISPAGTPFASNHPTANMCIDNDGEYVYINKSATSLKVVGFDDFSIEFMITPLPLTFGTTHTEGPAVIFDTVVPNAFIPDSFAILISNFQAQTEDSIKVTVTNTSDFNVDGWGNTTIPMGTYPSLRMYVEETTTTSYMAYCTDTIFGTGSGWYSVAALMPDETETTNRYVWWTDDANIKAPLAEMQVDSLGNAYGISFYYIPQTSSVNELISNEVKVFPIPTTYNLNIEVDNADANYKMYDLNGRLILQNAFNSNTKVDLSSLSKGTYLLNISTEKGNTTKKIIVE